MTLIRTSPEPDRAPAADPGAPTVVVGWTHRPLASGIELRVESSRSRRALEDGRTETVRLCMTRNQALLLARYLLDATGQPEPGRRRARFRWRWWR